mgnify:CR=1 FL=1
MKIAYLKGGSVVAETFTQEIEINFPHVVIEREILEPIESWYIEDGQIKIDRVKLKQIERERMRRLTLIEFATVLDAHGLLEAVEDYTETQAPLLVRIAYQRASFISRTDPTLIDMAEKLNISPDQVDAMWLSL